MNVMTTDIDTYFAKGCGRCNLFNTPQCKVIKFNDGLYYLHTLINTHKQLTQQIKWGQPCYTYNNKNVVMISAFKNYFVLSFFKGVLINDEQKVLELPGQNSQSVKFLKFTSGQQVKALEPVINKYIQQAIALEQQGQKVDFKKTTNNILPQELVDAFKQNKLLEKAFSALTPGKQRGYLLYFSAAKQTATKVNRIKKCVSKIIIGKGFNEA